VEDDWEMGNRNPESTIKSKQVLQLRKKY